MAASFLVVGVLFLALPSQVAEVLTDLGAGLGSFAEPPDTGLRLWLTLAFAYMVLISAICLVAQADTVRYRHLMLLLAVGKATSSLTALGFFLFSEDVFIYLLNFVVDGSLVLAALWLWSLSGRIGEPAAPG